ncbi:ATP-binding protein [uncultured Pseudodesulfovibrio sp.]|uniref:ATP-binding protein n=1 Tax=uncultured Pseudodesulfovibrio sp. TaxID=2035858 RepID=UPI0029C77644|nr:ATP-binding protein [uncultured Pseudodesulfovibrio sp.]
MAKSDPTFIGHVDSVSGSTITIQLKEDLPSLVMISGQSYRIGQIGAFVRIPVGYTQLYAICTLVGSAAAPTLDDDSPIPGHRWMRATLFGESMGEIFERGVSQFPTIDDEVHLVTPKDVGIIYESTTEENAITIGNIAASSGILGRLSLTPFVTRHSAILGSTGSGKSNLVAVIFSAISTSFPSSRAIIIDPHGEYASAVGASGKVFKINPERDEFPLYIPYWALPFDEFIQIATGGNLGIHETAIRDIITSMKNEAAQHLGTPPPETTVTADSPIPYSVKQLWFDLVNYERQTFNQNGGRDPLAPEEPGNPETLTPNKYPAAAAYNQAPYKNPTARNIERQLELLKSRLTDSRYGFLFNPGEQLTPDLSGSTEGDLDSTISSWIGHNKPITVFDMSGTPSEILPTIVGTLLRMIYDILFWGGETNISGKKQPLLMILEEAHLFLPEGAETPAQRTVARIAKEGRKYGVGLCVVSQRPSEINSTILSQCGTMISLRLSNSHDRSKVQGAMPDDLGALTNMLPSLKTGEGLVVGESVPIPTRIQFYRAKNKPVGDDPNVSEAWKGVRPSPEDYTVALNNWRTQSLLTQEEE